ncbi:MAG: ABC transporter ATP-binding protein, partial [Campylobacterales bacterium]
KSTLLRILGGLYPPTTGTYLFNGTPVGRRVPPNFRQQVGLLFQNPESMIFNPTVWDELIFSPRQFGFPDWRERGEKVAELLEITDLLGKSPLELSRGEQQRVMLGALLSYSPKLLLLDEPTSAMDPRHTGWFIHFLDKLEITAVIATHDLSIGYQLGTRAVVLGEEHQLLFDGEYDTLLSNRKLLERANLISRYPPKRCFCDSPYYQLWRDLLKSSPN